MWLRRAFTRWLFPAAVVLPLWLLIGWGVFQAGGWVFLWVLFIAIPSVLIGQVAMTLLVRARPSVRESGAVSWLDVAGFTVWHVLVIAVGCFIEAWFPLLLTAAIVAGLGMLWLSLRQLRREMSGVVAAGFAQSGFPPSGASDTGFARPGEVLIVTDAPVDDERPRPESDRPGPSTDRSSGGSDRPRFDDGL